MSEAYHQKSRFLRKIKSENCCEFAAEKRPSFDRWMRSEKDENLDKVRTHNFIRIQKLPTS